MQRKKTKSLVTTEGGLYGFELPAYGNQTKKRKEIWSDSYTGVYVLESLCEVRSCYSLCKVVFVH